MITLDVIAAFIHPTYDAGVTRTTPTAPEPDSGGAGPSVCSIDM